MPRLYSTSIAVDVLIKRLICWYVSRRCGGAFHYGPYGDRGSYIARVDEATYHKLTWLEIPK